MNDPLAGPYIVPSQYQGGSFGSVLGGALPLRHEQHQLQLCWQVGRPNSFITTGTGTADTVPGYSSSRYDDIMMNHVISFDVRVWDPGAPVFQVQTTVAGTAGPYSAVLPGDPGYDYALRSFINNPSPSNKTATLSSLGAYVDLSYMYSLDQTGVTYPTALERYARTVYGISTAVINPAYASTNTYNYYFPTITSGRWARRRCCRSPGSPELEPAIGHLDAHCCQHARRNLPGAVRQHLGHLVDALRTRRNR